MNLSAIGEAVLVAREGRRLGAYRDSVGIWTIGVGHTSAAGPPLVTPGLRLTEAACDALFRRDVARYVRAVAEAVPGDLPDHAVDALVSLCFNIGPAAFARSTVVRRLRAGDRTGAAAAILMWNRPAALIPRRGAEHDQFLTPYDRALPRARRGDANPVSVPGPAQPPLPAPRRTVPRVSAPLPTRAPGPAAPRPGVLERLWSVVRRLSGSR
ncbi:glycoside hydrolase [Methylobacterium sp. Leaf104]|uniref:lysozyme n=1 Tax=Methylobacterium TaxID=407 RepID=UPI0006F9CE51|nr:MULTISPECIES: lysozyme [Methylobacterium]KQP38270.1 glycoside hydrolase [Methylobacterium sp. Leaf104]MCI9880342.1 glycoside hydrolase family protein [Methylobacterium goesingense]